jgi:electron transfer flavoprotein alpha subunit
MSVLVVTELNHGGGYHPMSWEALAVGRQLGTLLGLPVKCLVVGGALDTLPAQAAPRGVSEVVTVEHTLLASYTADAFASAVSQAIVDVAPAFVVFPHTYQVRDYAPKLATALGGTFLSDCTALQFVEGTAVFSRQIFQGKLSADYEFAGNGPHLFSVQSGAFSPDADQADAAPIRALSVELDESAVRVRPTEPYQDAAGTVDLASAERIVSVGRGIKDPANIALAQKLADALGAELAASRPICDSGWLPLDRQVGSSGQTVTPKLYLALGISGAIQHQVGMKGSETIVAINSDESAPIFEIADYGVVGDLFEVVPELIKQLDH